jgi:hypothetical protein
VRLQISQSRVPDPVAAVFEMIAADASLAGIVLKLADTSALIDRLDSGRPLDRCI